ncbi:MAG TPA: hypothetical protein VFV26_01055 [Geothrix sp.]|nr:hypothetical protein [Geothrix sp.]
MLDLLLIPAGLFLALALRAVRRGEHRLHGHLMTAAFTLAGLRVLLHPRSLAQVHLTAWAVTLASAGATILLGRKALAWREGRSVQAFLPRIHRAAGTLTLVLAALTLVMWFLLER